MNPSTEAAREGIGGSDYRRAMRAELLRFAAGSRVESGFGWLDEIGEVDPSRPTQLWITCRMTHVFCLGLLANEPPAPHGPDSSQLALLAQHGVDSLLYGFSDPVHGGWFDAVDRDGPKDGTKSAYSHAFVLLAASSAVAAGLTGAHELLDRATSVWATRFWNEEFGVAVDEWDRTWTTLSDYRGINSNMHSVEALLAVADATRDCMWVERAMSIVMRVRDVAEAHGWRLPEHFDAHWNPVLDYNRDTPADPFRPFGATIGHGFEWARLFVATSATAEAHGRSDLMSGHDLAADAVRLTDRAIDDGWARDGEPGFVYTTDWKGRPVVSQRMHWVVAEALNTGWVLDAALGTERYRANLEEWWDFADQYLVDRIGGSWHHELDPKNRPSALTWKGKPDAYHAYQTALIPDLPLSPTLAQALALKARVPD